MPPPLHTVAPLLTTSRLRPATSPMNRKKRLLQSEPGPVTSTSLLPELLEPLTTPLAQLITPPASMISRLLRSLAPTPRSNWLLHTDPLPVTSARLLLLPAQ